MKSYIIRSERAVPYVYFFGNKSVSENSYSLLMAYGLSLLHTPLI